MTGRVDPRVARTRATVLAATREVLADGGFAALTIDGVARRSGVARTTIYRHWPSAAVLALDALRDVAVPAAPVDHGSVHDDLVALLRRLRTGLEQHELGRLLPTVLAGARHDRELEGLQRAFSDERRAPIVTAVAAGIGRGELPAGTDAEALADRLAGPVFYRWLVRSQPTTDADIDDLVTAALAGARAPVRTPA